MNMDYPLEVNGDAPDLNGLVCDGFICEAYLYDGMVEASANTTYLSFNEVWHRLYFDCGVIFWRSQLEAPAPWSVPEERWDYPHTDLARNAGVKGKRLLSYEMHTTDKGSVVEFTFECSIKIVVEDSYDRTDYRVIAVNE